MANPEVQGTVEANENETQWNENTIHSLMENAKKYLPEWMYNSILDIAKSIPFLGPMIEKELVKSQSDREELAVELDSKLINQFSTDEIAKLEQLGWADKDSVKEMLSVVAEKAKIPQDVFLTLIEKESAFDNFAEAQSSSAVWLSQMIDGTWETHGKWLDRTNPFHQAIAAARYLAFIKEKNDCSWEEATAYYNTWEQFAAQSNEPVDDDYIEWNLATIVQLIPGTLWKTLEELSGNITKSQYFAAATAYYSWKEYIWEAFNKTSDWSSNTTELA